MRARTSFSIEVNHDAIRLRRHTDSEGTQGEQDDEPHNAFVLAPARQWQPSRISLRNRVRVNRAGDESRPACASGHRRSVRVLHQRQCEQAGEGLRQHRLSEHRNRALGRGRPYGCVATPRRPSAGPLGRRGCPRTRWGRFQQWRFDLDRHDPLERDGVHGRQPGPRQRSVDRFRQ
jgi:hypothetical protein